jgi:hypothetical protein
MGLRDLLTGRTRQLLSTSVSLPLSPYSTPATLPQFVLEDVLGDELSNLPMDRAAAISIPAVSKARNLLVSTIAKFPLRAIRTNEDGTESDVTKEHPWLYRTNGPVSPYERMAWTIDDLIFHGLSLWLLDRGAPDAEGGRRPILNAEWCPPGNWWFGEHNGHLAVIVDGVAIAEDRYMLINSPFEGLLNVAQRTLKGVRDVEEAWVGRARNPIPMVNLARTEAAEITDEQLQDWVDAWAKKRTNPNGAVGSTPPGVDLQVFGELKAELMLEGRNAGRTDIGSHLGIRVAMLDGTIGIDSLTYNTQTGERNAFYEFDVPFWSDPITHRMSLDDIVPRGTRVRFDMYTAFTAPAPTGPKTED